MVELETFYRVYDWTVPGVDQLGGQFIGILLRTCLVPFPLAAV